MTNIIQMPILPHWSINLMLAHRNLKFCLKKKKTLNLKCVPEEMNDKHHPEIQPCMYVNCYMIRMAYQNIAKYR